jgi:hypothetical protein
MEIAPVATPESGDAEPAHPEDRTGLGSGRDIQPRLATFDQRDLNPGPQCCLSDADGHLVHQVGVMTLESGIRGDMDLDVQIAGWAESAA